jgi:hypothetical protein
MLREYGKRRYVPAACPQCGQGSRVLTTRDDPFISLLRAYAVGWGPVLHKTQWGPRWFGYCGWCVMQANITARSQFWDAVVTTKEFRSGFQISIPFGGSRTGILA